MPFSILRDNEIVDFQACCLLSSLRIILSYLRGHLFSRTRKDGGAWVIATVCQAAAKVGVLGGGAESSSPSSKYQVFIEINFKKIVE